MAQSPHHPGGASGTSPARAAGEANGGGLRGPGQCGAGELLPQQQGGRRGVGALVVFSGFGG
jgi:hypothetical protein